MQATIDAIVGALATPGLSPAARTRALTDAESRIAGPLRGRRSIAKQMEVHARIIDYAVVQRLKRASESTHFLEVAQTDPLTYIPATTSTLHDMVKQMHRDSQRGIIVDLSAIQHFRALLCQTVIALATAHIQTGFVHNALTARSIYLRTSTTPNKARMWRYAFNAVDAVAYGGPTLFMIPPEDHRSVEVRIGGFDAASCVLSSSAAKGAMVRYPPNSNGRPQVDVRSLGISLLPAALAMFRDISSLDAKNTKERIDTAVVLINLIGMMIDMPLFYKTMADSADKPLNASMRAKLLAKFPGTDVGRVQSLMARQRKALGLMWTDNERMEREKYTSKTYYFRDIRPQIANTLVILSGSDGSLGVVDKADVPLVKIAAWLLRKQLAHDNENRMGYATISTANDLDDSVAATAALILSGSAFKAYRDPDYDPNSWASVFMAPKPTIEEIRACVTCGSPAIKGFYMNEKGTATSLAYCSSVCMEDMM